MADIKEFKAIIDSTLFDKERKRPQSATPSRTKAVPAPQVQTKSKSLLINHFSLI